MASKKIDFDAVLVALESPAPMAAPTLREALAIADDRDFARAIIHYVDQLTIDGHPLRPAERIVFLVNDCAFRITQGGFTNPLLEMKCRDEAIAALVTIGAERFARVLREGANRFDAIPADDHERLHTIGELIDRAGSDELEALGRQIEGDTDEIDERLKTWIIRHRADFASD